ncbi:MAG: hypothetical protein U9R75_10855 [Candidatus Thermoplasmatota archaeon]|nr:hypothetical protein [Candidatus Thermoplasmatota archaeon]
MTPSREDGLDPLRSVLNRSRRNLTVIAHRARSDGNIQLKDLCGASGRWDGISRLITASLFLSHDMRRDTSVHVLLLGPDDPPKLLTVSGKDVCHLNPDERASSALMRKCLKCELGSKHGMQINPSPGIILTRADLRDVMCSMSGQVIMMDVNGQSFDPKGFFRENGDEGGSHFILSDDRDLEPKEVELIRKRSDISMNVGKVELHSNQVITIIHFLLDSFHDIP